MGGWRSASVMGLALAACSKALPVDAVPEAPWVSASVGPVGADSPLPATTALPLQDASASAIAAGTRILGAVAAAYAACATYEDEGTLERWDRDGSDFHVTVDFRTAFAGPRAVRFASRREPFDAIPEWFTQVIADDTGIHVTDGPDGQATEAESLGAATSGLHRRPTSFLSTITYRPRCNQPLAPEALRARSGKL